MNWLEKLNADPTAWLLEEDLENPSVRYWALLDWSGEAARQPQVAATQAMVMSHGPVPVILQAQLPEGNWVDRESVYNPKYCATVWSVSMLAQLGADGADPRVDRGCDYVLEHARSRYGGFSAGDSPAGMIDCLQGNLVAAMLDLGKLDDPRFLEALDWLTRSVIGEGIAPAEEKDAAVRYYRSGNSGPGFLCSANSHRPCAWGAVKVMLALSKLPAQMRTPTVRKAIDLGVEFLLSTDPAIADYPTAYDTKPSQSWFKFGFPVFYVTDVLQNLEALTALGYGQDERLRAALEFVLSKQDHQGRWKMEYTYNGKTWVDIESKKQPSKWVTLRALRVLKCASTNG